jgi:hypothetical protein
MRERRRLSVTKRQQRSWIDESAANLLIENDNTVGA